jgi:triacylglycerol lipase
MRRTALATPTPIARPAGRGGQGRGQAASLRSPVLAALAAWVLAAALCLPAPPAFAGDPAAAPVPMPAARLPAAPPRANDYPIVLVHGFLGFAGKGPLDLNYWGGCLDLVEELRARGYQAYAAEVGPVSSNWDRACELYAAIRGGRVDYGLAHARAAGHRRFGRDYPGLLPDWGETRPVHLLGHSMGGLTCRVLVQLLEEGDGAERAATPAGELSPLFAGGHSGERAWVRSVTSLSSPHDGTPAAYRFDTAKPALRRFAAGLYYRAAKAASAASGAAGGAANEAGEASGGPEEASGAAGGAASAAGSESLPRGRGLRLDLHLEAWGLAPEPGESAAHFRRRFAHAEDWWRGRDTGIWDGSPQGARELNLWVAARPDVYYFSWATEQTTRDPISCRQVPEPGMNFLIYSQAAWIGGWGRDPAWWPNDGIVSTCSMDGPSLGSSDLIVPYSGELRPGVWNFMGVLGSCDHLDVIGILSPRVHPAGSAGLPEFYAAIAALLAGLPE